MIKFTAYNLKKLEDLFSAVSYKVRYEKGNFQSGYCVVKDQKVAVINKFYDTEGRINCLLEILDSMEIPLEALSEKQAKFLKQIEKAAAQENNEEL